MSQRREQSVLQEQRQSARVICATRRRAVATRASDVPQCKLNLKIFIDNLIYFIRY